MTREEAIEYLVATRKFYSMMEKQAGTNDEAKFGEALDLAIESLSADADGANLINRHDAVTVIREECRKCNNTINDDLFMRIMSLPTSQQTDCTDFIMWLIEVVLDEEDWELNVVGYGEIIARKLKKLGLLEVKDGYYIRHIENNTKKSDLVYRLSAEPSGDVNAVEIYEQAERELERGQITLGEFEERIKPLKHLNYSAVRPKGEPETEPAPVVAYICDRRRCAICRGPGGECDHTTDIKHAAHFKNVAGQYFERPYMEEDDG